MSNNPKILKNLKNSLVFKKKMLKAKKNCQKRRKKCYPLSFPILGGSDSARALQPSPFQKYKNLEKFQKITFFQEKKYL